MAAWGRLESFKSYTGGITKKGTRKKHYRKGYKEMSDTSITKKATSKGVTQSDHHQEGYKASSSNTVIHMLCRFVEVSGITKKATRSDTDDILM